MAVAPCREGRAISEMVGQTEKTFVVRKVLRVDAVRQMAWNFYIYRVCTHAIQATGSDETCK